MGLGLATQGCAKARETRLVSTPGWFRVVPLGLTSRNVHVRCLRCFLRSRHELRMPPESSRALLVGQLQHVVHQVVFQGRVGDGLQAVVAGAGKGELAGWRQGRRRHLPDDGRALGLPCRPPGEEGAGTVHIAYRCAARLPDHNTLGIGQGILHGDNLAVGDMLLFRHC
mgnify:CR=1 FL=1